MYQRLSIILVAALVMLTVVGCGKPPEAEMQAANASFDAARAAEAEQYVQGTFNAAQDTLNAAMAMKQEQDAKFALFRSYGKAKEMFVKAEQMANQAATEAAAEKERVKAMVTEQMTVAQAALDSASTAMDKAPKGKGNKAEIELMKADLDAAKAAFEQAKTSFDAGKYLQAQNEVKTVIDRAHKLSDEIALARTMKK
ncbi:MAG: hypothetical protein C4524_08890 [Candidatus Zixiibacteriota bacterium]|nr:MAG: hypothetical protein C4524_08890 [candidate division Zixibacteria bacterium]